MKTLKITAKKTEYGYVMMAENGEKPQDGRAHTSRQSVYADCESMYDNPTWRGRKAHAGYVINID